MLERINITNFKVFGHQEISLRPFTLLTGPNSSGKSTGLLEDGDDSGLLLNGELVQLGTGQDVRHEAYKKDDPSIGLSIVPAEGTAGPLSWQAAYGPEDDLLRLLSAPRAESVLRELPELFGPRFQYLKADRIVPGISYPRSHHAVVRRGFLGARGEHTANYLRVHLDDPVEAALRHPSGVSGTLLAQTDAWMQQLCPGVHLQAIGIDGTDTVRLSYGFGSGVNASNRYRPTNVGFGLTYVLPVVVACLTAQPGSLILLENPEAHLHPQGQTSLAYLAASAVAAGAQLLVETHSDHVLNGVRISVKNHRLQASQTAVHFFRRSGQSAEVVSPRMGADGMLSQWPQGFFDEWENSLDELLD
jgi:predicted ATPase